MKNFTQHPKEQRPGKVALKNLRRFVSQGFLLGLAVLALGLLIVTPSTDAGIWPILWDSTGWECIEFPVETPMTFAIYMENDAGDAVTGLSLGFRVYSLNGAVWQPLDYDYHSDFPAESFFDVYYSSAFSNDGSGADTVGFVAMATSTEGLPNGYDDVILRITTGVEAAYIGDTLCIDSTWFPATGVWQWETPTGSFVPDWGGPYCYAIVPQEMHIEGAVFRDLDNDGIWDKPAEPGMPGVTVNLSGTSTGTTVTGSNGEYSFTNLTPGTYKVYEDVPGGYVQTMPTSVIYKFTSTAYAVYTDVDFGNTYIECPTEVTVDTCFLGTIDNFVGAEPSYPDAELLTAMSGAYYGAVPYFDSVVNDQAFGHTFDCWQDSCKVVGATLCLSVRADNGGASNDRLHLGEWGTVGGFYVIDLEDLELLAGGDGNFIGGEVITICLDLANLPASAYGVPQNILGGLRDGRLDVLISDDTECDYLELIVETCCDTSCYADGDFNDDGIALTIADLVDLIQFLTGTGPAPVVPYSCDLNGDGIIDGKDVQVYQDYFVSGLSAFAPYGGYPVPCPCDPILAPAHLSLDPITGTGARPDVGKIIGGSPVTFSIRLTNNTGTIMTDLAHGFQVYSPNGANWTPLTYSLGPDFPGESFFDVIWTGDFSNDGSGADTVGFYANAGMAPGDILGYKDVILEITTTVSASSYGDTLCIDSCFFQPTGTWEWQASFGSVTPLWEGPQCFEIVSFPAETVVSDGITYTSLGLCSLTVNQDVTIGVRGAGGNGQDGVQAQFEATPAVNIQVETPEPIPTGGAIICQVPPSPNGGCCQYGDHCFPANPGEGCGLGGVYHADTRCMQYPDTSYCGWPMDWLDNLYTSPMDYVQLVLANEGNDSLKIDPLMPGPMAPYVAHIYNGGLMVDSMVCETGESILTGNDVPSEITMGDDVQLSWGTTMSFRSSGGGDSYVGDEIRFSQPGAISRGQFEYAVIRNVKLDEVNVRVNVTSCCVGIRGNIDSDSQEVIDISDLVYLVDFMFTGGPAPACHEEADVNGDGGEAVDIGDLVYLVDYMFSGGPEPPACGSSPAGRIASAHADDIRVSLTYDDGASTITLNTPIDLRGLQLELKGTGIGGPENLLGESLDLVHGRDGWTVKVGLLDLDGGEIIEKGSRAVIRLDGKYTLESARVADLAANSIAPVLGSVVSNDNLPTEYGLCQNYPNPFNPRTSISFALPQAAATRLEIFNLLGQRVVTLIDTRLEAGRHAVDWEGCDGSGRSVASGVYFYRLETPEFTASKKMLLLK